MTDTLKFFIELLPYEMRDALKKLKSNEMLFQKEGTSFF